MVTPLSEIKVAPGTKITGLFGEQVSSHLFKYRKSTKSSIDKGSFPGIETIGVISEAVNDVSPKITEP